jgi:HK97 gp10 family phage protein
LEAAVRVDNRPSDPRALRDLANSPEVQEVTRRLAKSIQRDARRLAPRRTGNLARHIAVEEITDLTTGVEGFAVGWDDKGWYGQMVEFGTEHTTARPHLTPAAIRNGARGPGGDR